MVRDLRPVTNVWVTIWHQVVSSMSHDPLHIILGFINCIKLASLVTICLTRSHCTTLYFLDCLLALASVITWLNLTLISSWHIINRRKTKAVRLDITFLMTFTLWMHYCLGCLGTWEFISYLAEIWFRPSEKWIENVLTSKQLMKATLFLANGLLISSPRLQLVQRDQSSTLKGINQQTTDQHSSNWD